MGRNPKGRRPPKLAPSGVPVDTRDWTEADWADLHYGLIAIQSRIAARHAKRRAEAETKEAES